MRCPECDHEKSRIVRTIKCEHVTWRTHRCLSCGYQWSTSEIEDERLEPLTQLQRENHHA